MLVLFTSEMLQILVGMKNLCGEIYQQQGGPKFWHYLVFLILMEANHDIRCLFKVFMKEKPGKYGLLIRILTDCSTPYVLRVEVTSIPALRGPNGIVKRLLSPIQNSGRTATTLATLA